MLRRTMFRLVVLLGLMAITSAPALAQHPEHERASWKDSDEGRMLLERADEIVELTRAFRGVGTTAPVKKGLMLRDELRDVLFQKFEEETDDAELRGEFLSLVRLGLIDPDLDYEKFLLDLLTEQIAGFYDNEKQELYILEGQDEATLDAVMSHELFHAIQDQTWSIERVRGPERENTDRTTARVALIEGDASAVMLDFELAPEGASFTDIPFLEGLIRGLVQATGTQTGAANDLLASAPLVLQESLVFPYVEGMLFVAAIKKRGGWPAVDALYLDPPMSTEQILHPERYLERDHPVAVDFAIPAALGTDAIFDSVSGELGLRLFLKQHFVELAGGDDVALAYRAAEGWDGDRARLYENGDGAERLFVQLVALDSESDAAELTEALDRVSALRYPGAQRSALAGVGQRRGATFFTGKEHLWIEQRGTEVLYVEGLATARHGEHAPQRLLELAETVWLTRTHEPYPAFADELSAQDSVGEP